jgi:hypothetical protein
MQMTRKCTATTKAGRPCKAWAQRNSEPPLCRLHRDWPTVVEKNPPLPNSKQAEPHSETETFYSRRFSSEELTAKVGLTLDRGLRGEVAITRVAIRRILTQLEKELAPEEYARLASLLFNGARTIAQLLRAQRALSGEAAEGISGAMAQALDELATIKGRDL